MCVQQRWEMTRVYIEKKRSRFVLFRQSAANSSSSLAPTAWCWTHHRIMTRQFPVQNCLLSQLQLLWNRSLFPSYTCLLQSLKIALPSQTAPPTHFWIISAPSCFWKKERETESAVWKQWVCTGWKLKQSGSPQKVMWPGQESGSEADMTAGL